MSSLVALLEARGFWRFELRPAEFDAQRVPTTDALRRCIEQARVELRGWDFPHIGSTWPLPESQDWIGLEIESGTHVEVWRAFRSGQFVYRGGVWSDWLDRHWVAPNKGWEPSKTMPIVSSLWSLTEFFEFAARYSQTDAAADGYSVSVTFTGLKGRLLVGDHERRVWHEPYGPARMEQFAFVRALSRVELVGQARALALQAAEELFAGFGYTPHPGVLGGIQDELYASRRGA